MKNIVLFYILLLPFQGFGFTVVPRPSIVLKRPSELHMSDNDDNMERTWRYAGKPLLRIGSKGANPSHGNSLRELLNQHTVVKIKINMTRKFDNSLENAFEKLRELAIDSGASPEIELLQYRDYDKMIMVGLPGTRSRIQSGKFPEVEEEPEESDE